MKLISWNVNGLRACVGKNFLDFFNEVDADIFCIQESKLQEGQIDLDLPGYYQYWNYAEKKGYSGTAIFSKQEPLSVSYGIGIEEHDKEGRVITLEFDKFYMITVYTPNSQNELARLSYRMEWEDAFLAYLKNLEKNKPVVFCGDLNVAHKEIDLKNPKTNRKNAGFTDEERACMTHLQEVGFVDTFRHFYPDKEGRVITLEFDKFYMITVYTPNSQNELARLSYRMEWEDAFLAYLKNLEKNKPVVFCRDLNVAHKEIDLKNPKTNRKNAGFTDEEREKFSCLLENGFIDTFRYFYPDVEGIYSWWSYRFQARAKNAGWRIDYFMVSESLKDKLQDAEILTDIYGSDHCPVVLEIGL